MAVVQERPPLVQGAPGPPDSLNADLLFKEARQRERRRRLVWVGVVVIVVGTVVAAALVIGSRSTPSPSPARVSASSRPKSTGVPTGSIVFLKRAGPLAVSPTGALYVSDPTRHQVLVRLANGRFRVAAGDGRFGFAGDDGPATRAELSDVRAMAFAPNGDLYLADGSRVRAVDQKGTIRTIAGNGRFGTVPDGTPALSAPLGPVASIAFSPNGQLYLSTSHYVTSRLLRLTPAGQFDSLPANLLPGQVQMPGPLNSFASIAVDAQGNVYASSTFDGWSVFKISPDGVATYLGYARRSGGTTAIVQRGPNNVIEVDDGENILQVEGGQLVTTLAVNTVPGFNTFIFTDFFALAPDGALYADNLGPPAFEPFQQIVSVTDGHGLPLWRGSSRR
jgi:sugar lactone lactonase YvrE